MIQSIRSRFRPLRQRAVARVTEFDGNAGIERGTVSRRITSLVIPA
jgi:hypothetical protein